MRVIPRRMGPFMARPELSMPACRDEPSLLESASRQHERRLFSPDLGGISRAETEPVNEPRYRDGLHHITAPSNCSSKCGVVPDLHLVLS